MRYPMKEVGFNGVYREMTPQEYETELEWYRQKSEEYSASSRRRVQEYGAYLKRWFGDGECDGYRNYEQRRKFCCLPQTMNGYLYE